MASGLLHAIARFIFAFFCGTIIGTSFAHLSVETQWMIDLRGHSDLIYKSYIAMAYEFHVYNNPIG